MTIGVFDSGVGGQSVASAVKKAFPTADVVYVADTKNIPYGTKTPDELLQLVSPILNKLSIHCDAIVVACNTVSTTIIKPLREQIHTPLIAVEPMIKPAAAITKSGTIAVCATPTTLASKRYGWLKDEYAKELTVLEPDCSDWSYMIETKQMDRRYIEEQINDVCEQGADVIVLGCTHYHWIEDIIRDIANDRAVVIQPEQAVVKQLERVLEQQP